MKKLILICLMLSGCGSGDMISKSAIDRATQACESNGGVRLFESMAMSDNVIVYCNNANKIYVYGKQQ